MLWKKSVWFLAKQMNLKWDSDCSVRRRTASSVSIYLISLAKTEGGNVLMAGFLQFCFVDSCAFTHHKAVCVPICFAVKYFLEDLCPAIQFKNILANQVKIGEQTPKLFLFFFLWFWLYFLCSSFGELQNCLKLGLLIKMCNKRHYLPHRGFLLCCSVNLKLGTCFACVTTPSLSAA